MCWKMPNFVRVCFIDGLLSSISISNQLILGLSGIKEYSDWPTIPQLYLEKEFIGGCDILMSMHQNGELAKLLEEKGVLVAAD